ncbi:MAG: hypothetical protein AB7F38_03165 [Piscinibacter sp.]
MRTASCLVLMLAAVAAADAEAHGRHGRWWGGVSIGIGVPLYIGPRVVDPWYGYPAPVVVAPPPAVYAEPAPLPAKAPPEPIFYPARGQSAAQLEADRQECNRWATTQPSAMADAGVFHRATLACMDARGYTSR